MQEEMQQVLLEEEQQPPVVRLLGVSKIISSKKLVDQVTLEIGPGQVFGFLGPNGAGKTTTIRMMAGLISISKGDIEIAGYSIRHDFKRAIAHVGAIVENPEMYKFLTGYQNLIHFARMMPDIPKERIDEVVELVGLSNRIHDKVKTYSLGMRQRLGVAQAILHRPKLLILDEPTNGLDPQGIRELRDYLRHLCHTEGTTVFVSSHLLSEMELMCDTVAIIQQGKLIDVRALRPIDAQQAISYDVAFEVDHPEGAVVALGFGRAEEKQIIVQATRAGIADINERLVQAGIKVYGIHTVIRSLEEQFLEMTGSDQIG